MTDEVENNASLAWRVLATLEVGCIAVIGTAAILAHTVRTKWRTKLFDPHDTVHTVLISSDSKIGRQIKTLLELHGCAAHILISGATSDAIRDATGDAIGVTANDSSGGVTSDDRIKNNSDTFNESKFVDALVVIGSENKPCDLDRLSEIVSEDISFNIKKLNSLCMHVRRGGRLVWVSMSDATSGPFSGATLALNDVIRANLELVAKSSQQKAVWVRRRSDSDHKIAERVVAALLSNVRPPLDKRFSIRNTASRVAEYVWRWFKVVS